MALAGDAMALKKLLGAQGKPNTSDLKLRTPLHVAAQEVGLKVTKMFATSKIFLDIFYKRATCSGFRFFHI